MSKRMSNRGMFLIPAVGAGFFGEQSIEAGLGALTQQTTAHQLGHEALNAAIQGDIRQAAVYGGIALAMAVSSIGIAVVSTSKNS